MARPWALIPTALFCALANLPATSPPVAAQSPPGLPAYDAWRVVAGGGRGTAEFDRPEQVATDVAGNVYVADSKNHRIQKLSSSGLPLATFGSLGSQPGQYLSPDGVAVDPGGNIYVTDPDNHRVDKLDATGNVLLSFGADLPAGPGQKLAVGPDGSVWLAHHNAHSVYHYTASGQLIARYGGTSERPGEIGGVDAISVGSDGILYVGNSTQDGRGGVFGEVVKVSPAGQVLARLRGPGWQAGGIKFVGGVAVDADHNVYVGDPSNNRILKLAPSGDVLKILEGLPLLSFDGVTSLVMAPGGSLVLSDVTRGLVAELGPDGQPAWIAGQKPLGSAELEQPTGVTVDEQGNMFVADAGNYRIQRFAVDGTVTTAWGELAGEALRLTTPQQVTLDAADHLYVLDYGAWRVLELDPYGQVLRILGSGSDLQQGLNTPGQFPNPTGVAVDAARNVYVAEADDDRIQSLAPDGSVSIVRPATVQRLSPVQLAASPDGTLYLADANRGVVQRLRQDGSADPAWPGKEAHDTLAAYGPAGITLDAAGNVWVTSVAKNPVVAIAPDGTLLGGYGSRGSGIGQFEGASGIWVDVGGTVYVADTGNNRIQAMSPTVAAGYAPDPVITSTGEYVYSWTDSRITSQGGSPIAFTRIYRGGGAGSTALGPGWAHTFDVSLSRQGVANPADLVVKRPAGSTEFNATETGEFQAAHDAPEILERNPDGTYASRTADGRRWTFNPGGLLTSVEDGQGHVARLTYDGSRVAAIGDDADPAALTMRYDSCFHARLCSITDKADPPRVTTFRYDADGQLVGVTNREGDETQYQYAAAGKLGAIQDALGRTAITLAYDTAERVVSEKFSTGRVTRFSYDLNANGTGRSVYTETPAAYTPDYAPTTADTYSNYVIRSREWQTGPADDPLVETRAATGGSLRTCTWSGGATQPPQGFVEGSGPTGESPHLPLTGACAVQPLAAPGSATNLSLTLSKLAWADTRRQFGEDLSHASEIQHDAVGRIVGVTDTSGADPKQWQLEYDREDRVTRVRQSSGSADADANVSQLTYDAVGNLTRITEPDGEIDEFAYDLEDALVAMHTSVGYSAEFAYDRQGNPGRSVLIQPDGTVDLAMDYAYDGLHRPRRLTSYPHWPEVSDARVTEYVWDETGAAHPYVPSGVTSAP